LLAGPLGSALVGFVVEQPRAALAQNPPPGMVPYDHPVYHNGKRVLWHWAGRKVANTEAGGGEASKHPRSIRSQPVFYNFSVFSDGDDSAAFRMAADIVTAVKSAGLRARQTVGRTAAPALEKLAPTDIADFVIAPVDALVDDSKSSWKDKAPYVAPLGLERIEIVAPKDTTRIADLDGKKVAVGPADSADQAVAMTLFGRLGVKPEFVLKPLSDGLADLAAGKVAAVVATGETDSKALGDFGKDGKHHLVPLAMTPALAAYYSPLTLTAKDRPNLIGPDEKAPTLAEPMALVAMGAPPNSARAQRDEAFVDALFEKLPTLMSGEADPNWRDVNIAATLDWPRLGSADAWITAHSNATDAAFANFRKVAAGDGAPDAERLFESLMQARSANP
jgi:hypothetical protein